MKETIKIKKYEPRVENGSIKVYAIPAKGGEPILIPDAFATMCDENHLAIVETEFERPELFGLSDPRCYIPLRTVQRYVRGTEA